MRLIAIVDTNEIEATVFDIRTESFSKRKFFLNKNIKFSNLKYITNNYNDNFDDYNIIYLIVNTGLNSFYLIDYSSGDCSEMAIPDDIGFNPTFMRLNKKYLISICGKNSDSVYIFDTYKLIWYNVGILKSGFREGAYAMYLSYYNIVLICGGMNENGDNSLDIEYFDMKEFEKKISNDLTENKEINIEIFSSLQNDYLLRKSFPYVINSNNYKTFIICGGEGLISKTDTCVIFKSESKMILMSPIILPNPISEENPNTFKTKESIYSFENDNIISRFDIIDKSFKLIEKF